MRSTHKVIFAMLALAGILAVMQPVLAHHSGAEFDNDKTVEITGTIKEFQFKNPHTWIQVVVEGKGQPVEWVEKWLSPNPNYEPAPAPRAACGCGEPHR